MARTPKDAHKTQKWFIDGKGRKVVTHQPVPVDEDDHRTPHLMHTCPKCGTDGQWLLPGTRVFCPDHGTALVAPKQGNRGRALLAETVRLYGNPAALWTVPAVAAAVDLAWSPTITEALQSAPAPVIAGAAAYVAVKRTLTARAIKRGRMERGQRTGRRVTAVSRRARQAAAWAAEGSLWSLALATTDASTVPGLLVGVAGLARWALLCAPYWRYRKGRTFSTAVVVVPEAPVVHVDTTPTDPVRDAALATWDELLGGPVGSPLPGTHIVEYMELPASQPGNPKNLPRNWYAKVEAKRAGSVNMRQHRPTLRGSIAAAYRCTEADIAFVADEQDLSVGHLRVEPDNPLARVDMWHGPDASCDWERGVSRVGRFSDGHPVPYVWWTDLGAAHNLISGCTGSGKSEFVAQLLLCEVHSGGRVLSWVADPQGGQSYGPLRREVDWFATTHEEITFMLLAACKEMFRRNTELTERGIKTWHPGIPGMPLLTLTLDEIQSYVSNPLIGDMVKDLAGMARKCGIKVRAITQIPSAYNLGGNTYTKEQLQTGQSFVFRAQTSIAAASAVDGDCPIDPTALPSTWGPRTCNPGGTTAGLMFVRGIHGRDLYARADFTGKNMSRWFETPVSPAQFSGKAASVSGPLWGDRKARAELSSSAGKSDAELLPGGAAVALIEQASVSGRFTSGTPAVNGSAGNGSTGTQPAGRGGKPPAREAILAAARQLAGPDGVVKRDQLRATCSHIPDGTFNTKLGDLVSSGELTRLKNGIFQVVSR